MNEEEAGIRRHERRSVRGHLLHDHDRIVRAARRHGVAAGSEVGGRAHGEPDAALALGFPARDALAPLVARVEEQAEGEEEDEGVGSEDERHDEADAERHEEDYGWIKIYGQEARASITRERNVTNRRGRRWRLRVRMRQRLRLGRMRRKRKRRSHYRGRFSKMQESRTSGA